MSWLALMCVNPFSSVTDSLFAYTGHNESLIQCCHLQPSVIRSQINSWSSRVEKEQRSRMVNYASIYVWRRWVFSNKTVTLHSLVHIVLIVFCVFRITSFFIINPPSFHLCRRYFQTSHITWFYMLWWVTTLWMLMQYCFRFNIFYTHRPVVLNLFLACDPILRSHISDNPRHSKQKVSFSKIIIFWSCNTLLYYVAYKNSF